MTENEILPPELRTDITRLTSFSGSSIEDLETFMLRMIGEFSKPVKYSFLNSRYSRLAKRFGQTVKQIVLRLEREGRIATRFSDVRRRTYVYSVMLWKDTKDDIVSHGLDEVSVFENMERESI